MYVKICVCVSECDLLVCNRSVFGGSEEGAAMRRLKDDDEEDDNEQQSSSDAVKASKRLAKATDDLVTEVGDACSSLFICTSTSHR